MQTVFLIDLPKLEVPDAGKTPFYKELVYFLQASDLHRNIIKKLDGFDFSETKRYAFVHTVYVFPLADSHIKKEPPANYTSGGTNTGDKWQRTGFSGLGRAVKTLGLETNAPINVDYIVSFFIYYTSIHNTTMGILTSNLGLIAGKSQRSIPALDLPCLQRYAIIFQKPKTDQLI